MSALKKLAGKLFIPLSWTVFIQILLCLPGSAIPDAQQFHFLNIENIDKVAHVIIFGTFVVLWCLYFSRRVPAHQQLKLIFFAVFLVAAFNGIAIEYIQKYFIANRSFDEGDIIADLLSASIGYGICNVRLLHCVSGRTSTGA